MGIEFAVHLISPADSIALVSSLPPKMQLGGRVLWPRCGQLPRARERERNDTLPRRPTLKSLRGTPLHFNQRANMTEERKHAIPFAATLLCARKLFETIELDKQN